MNQAMVKKIREVKTCGQFIIDNAEKIVAQNAQATGIDIIIHIKGGRRTKIELCVTGLPPDYAQKGGNRESKDYKAIC